jgi:hypothetical protein
VATFSHSTGGDNNGWAHYANARKRKLPGGSSGAGATHEERDQPDERSDDGKDEEPLDDEAETDEQRDDQSKDDQENHWLVTSLSAAGLLVSALPAS